MVSDAAAQREYQPETVALLRYFEYGHLPAQLAEVSRSCRELAFEMAGSLPDGPQLRAGLLDLLRAKDCFVRCQVDARRTT